MLFRCLGQLLQAQETPPNIIFFIADDMYPDMFNKLPEGHCKNLTPNIDRLAKEISYLGNLYVASPVCTPSRYDVLTGNYASRASNDALNNLLRKTKDKSSSSGIHSLRRVVRKPSVVICRKWAIKPVLLGKTTSLKVKSRSIKPKSLILRVWFRADLAVFAYRSGDYR